MSTVVEGPGGTRPASRIRTRRQAGSLSPTTRWALRLSSVIAIAVAW
jgi:NitT/TauT family transport system permease protein